MTSIYQLGGDYYQKLGECWDHEVKDFKAHYIAVSTFERWDQKFNQISEVELYSLPSDVAGRIVPPNAVESLSFGSMPYPVSTYPLPNGIIGRRARVDFATDQPISLGSTDSGYGSRSHRIYHTIDFAPQFESMILDRKKTATTRVTAETVSGSEPHLHDLVKLFVDTDASKGGIMVHATTSHLGSVRVFAKIEITAVELQKMGYLSTELARQENFNSIEELKQCLTSFYPSLSDNDNIVVFRFKLCEEGRTTPVAPF